MNFRRFVESADPITDAVERLKDMSSDQRLDQVQELAIWLDDPKLDPYHVPRIFRGVDLSRFAKEDGLWHQFTSRIYHNILSKFNHMPENPALKAPVVNYGVVPWEVQT